MRALLLFVPICEWAAKVILIFELSKSFFIFFHKVKKNYNILEKNCNFAPNFLINFL